MKLKVLILATVGAGICLSCKNGNEQLDYKEPVFKEVVNPNIKSLNSSFIFGNGSIRVVDTLVIYSGLTDISDKNFHVFSKNTGKYLNSFGNVGRARGELSVLAAGFSVDKENRMLYVFDANLDKTLSYSLNKVMDGDNNYVNEINLPDIVSNISSK